MNVNMVSFVSTQNERSDVIDSKNQNERSNSKCDVIQLLGTGYDVLILCNNQ
jgi:hypothetical protein